VAFNDALRFLGQTDILALFDGFIPEVLSMAFKPLFAMLARHFPLNLLSAQSKNVHLSIRIVYALFLTVSTIKYT
jgi:hypothetical protein